MTANDLIISINFNLEQARNNLTARQWIPVEDRLPQEGERVLCYCKDNIYDVLSWKSTEGWYYDRFHCFVDGLVIAWMPLPKYEEVKE